MKLSEVVCKAFIFLGIGVVVLSIAPRLLSRVNMQLGDSQNKKRFEEQIEANKDKPVELDHGDIKWEIVIPRIDLDYYVYHNEQDNYYLHRDEYGNDSMYGQLYFNNSEPDIIYGHNMKDNTMFGRLDELYEGCAVTLKDMTYNDCKTYNYRVVNTKAVGANEVYSYLSTVDYDKALVTCNPTHDKGRLIVVLKEV